MSKPTLCPNNSQMCPPRPRRDCAEPSGCLEAQEGGERRTLEPLFSPWRRHRRSKKWPQRWGLAGNRTGPGGREEGWLRSPEAAGSRLRSWARQVRSGARCPPSPPASPTLHLYGPFGPQVGPQHVLQTPRTANVERQRRLRSGHLGLGVQGLRRRHSCSRGRKESDAARGEPRAGAPWPGCAIRIFRKSRRARPAPSVPAPPLLGHGLSSARSLVRGCTVPAVPPLAPRPRRYSALE
ncbi:uncharacterized protein LOC107976149 [Pan troglodytes]|uniref:uncharacterized protein LOC107976149 n=1 Tax=Pan troglodytes TaxID=9598 RepID=UPI0030135415